MSSQLLAHPLATHLLAVASPGAMGTGEKVSFWVLGIIALGCAIGMVAARNAMHSALFLVVTMFCLGIFYIIQAGPFIGMAQIIVYTGAIMMLFLFVLMLIGRDVSDSLIETLRGQRTAGILIGLGLALLLGTGLARGLGAVDARGLEAANAEHGGNVPGLAALVFTRYVFAFEVTSALLITAAVGAMVLAHVQRRGEKKTQKELSRERFAEGSYPAPKTGPGVFAHSNSVATPAILPDGTKSARSISPLVPPRELTAEDTRPKDTLTGGDQ
ncbi:NADH-quinone oxidoreductase subunit J [Actinocatenispora sera]|uniref:NADH-quinone oxidoreductase subunit J n=1 Tax=Actinocatenispora sera TaxID=390989 RepID=A0A810L0Y2_9ACTN|nr:NADH-quinone oxidoreductase subunit J [Actinocatenispora sera]BCJ27878.1 NADH:ubiquinone oxidoreductase subunit J [Actinocatenispora sera]